MRDPIDDLRRYARTLETEVSSGRARFRVERAVAAAGGTRRPRRTIAALAIAGLMVLSNATLAMAAEPAVPGDPLYGIDRAYERVADRVGLGGSHAAERLDEAQVLVERGRAAEALDLVREALSELAETKDLGVAHQLLSEMVESAPGLSEALRGDNGALTGLLEVAHSVAEGEEVDGQKVADAAKQLRDAVTQNTPAAYHEPGGPPTDHPGPPSEHGGAGVTPPSNPGHDGDDS